jgi:hypothetical protein
MLMKEFWPMPVSIMPLQVARICGRLRGSRLLAQAMHRQGHQLLLHEAGSGSRQQQETMMSGAWTWRAGRPVQTTMRWRRRQWLCSHLKCIE